MQIITMLKFLIKNTLSRIGRLLYKDNLGKQILDNPSEFPKIILLRLPKKFLFKQGNVYCWFL